MVNRGPCQGDSGGPLLVRSGGVYVQAGVLKAADCTSSGSYSEVGAGGNRDWLPANMAALPYAPFGVADWDADGKADVIARHDPTGDLWPYPGQSTRGYGSASRVLIGSGWLNFSL